MSNNVQKKYTLAKNINSEEYLKEIKSKLELKIKLQNVKSDVKAKM